MGPRTGIRTAVLQVRPSACAPGRPPARHGLPCLRGATAMLPHPPLYQGASGSRAMQLASPAVLECGSAAVRLAESTPAPLQVFAAYRNYPFCTSGDCCWHQDALLCAQVHYQIVRPEGDRTGVRLKMTRAPQPRGAGMMMWASGFTVPPRTPSHLVPNRCCYSGFQPLTGFAFRVHAHALGRCPPTSLPPPPSQASA